MGYAELMSSTWTGFNPRPAPRSGAMAAKTCGMRPARVSIRAPLRGAGRLNSIGQIAIATQFQSAPRSEERGDWPEKLRATPEKVFQSAPRSEERGDSRPPSLCLAPCSFQSAPRSEERGDLRRP